MPDVWRLSIILWFVIGGMLIVLNVLGGFAYDIRETVLRMRLRRRVLRKPSVTVLIPVHDGAAEIAGCLDSLRASRYRKMNIVVVDGRSTDGTVREVRRYIRRYRLKSVRLVARRRPLTTMRQLVRDTQTYITGEYVLWLTPHARVSPDAIEAAVLGLQQHPEAGLLVPQRRVAGAPGMAGVFQHYMLLLAHRTDKMRSVLGIPPKPMEADFLFFRRPAIAGVSSRCPALPGSTPVRLDAPSPRRPVYIHDVSITLPSAQSFGQLFSVQRKLQGAAMAAFFHPSRTGLWSARFIQPVLQALHAAFALLTPFIISYFIYLSVGLHQPKLLLAAWLALAVLLVSAALTDEQVPLRRKLASIAGMPVSFGFFFAFSFLPLLSLLQAALPPLRRPVRIRPA